MGRNPLFLAILLTPVIADAQLNVNTGLTPAQLVNNLTGGGVTVSNISFNGVAAPGVAQAGSGAFTAVGSNLGLGAGIILGSGDPLLAAGAGNTFASAVNGTGPDPDLGTLSGMNISDRAVLEFDFVPTGDQVSFNFVFGSEEYPAFVCSFNDAFGFFLSGPGINGPFTNNAMNIALLPDNVTPVTIANVNGGQNNNPADPNCPAVNPQYYVDNTAGATIAYNGMTTVLQAQAAVQCGQTYHIKLAIGDAGDSSYDSAVFLEAGSFTSPPISVVMLGGATGLTAPCMDPVNVSVQNVQGGNAPFNYTWSTGGTFVANGQNASAIANAPHYMVVNVVDACGATAVDSVLVSPEPFTLVMPQDQTIPCLTTTDLTPQLQNAGQTASYAFTWTANGSTVGSVQTLNVLAPAQPTQFDLTVMDQCGASASGSVMVSTLVNDPITVTAMDDLVIPCSATSAELNVISVAGGNGVYAFEWMTNGNVVGSAQAVTVDDAEATYTVNVIDGCGEIGSDEVSVSTQVYPQMQVSASEDVTVFCPGDNATMTMTSATGGEAPYAMSWIDGNSNTLSTTATLTVPVPVNATYALVITDQCGNTAMDQVNAFVPQYAPLTLFLSRDTTICAGTDVELSVSATGGSGVYAYNWTDLGTADSIALVSPESPSTYSVTVTEACGESASGAVQIDIEMPVTNIVTSNLGEDAWQFSAFSQPAAATYDWDFGDGGLAGEAGPRHAYADFQEHVVTLTITTALGCTATDTVHLGTAAHLYFPNAFTPDGDGINERFGPMGNDITVFEMTIFDRWGAPVVSAQGIGASWDGRLADGGMAPEGVYVYHYHVAGVRMPEQNGLGHVTLLGSGTAQN